MQLFSIAHYPVYYLLNEGVKRIVKILSNRSGCYNNLLLLIAVKAARPQFERRILDLKTGYAVAGTGASAIVGLWDVAWCGPIPAGLPAPGAPCCPCHSATPSKSCRIRLFAPR